MGETRERGPKPMIMVILLIFLPVIAQAAAVRTAGQSAVSPMTRGGRFMVTINGLPNSSAPCGTLTLYPGPVNPVTSRWLLQTPG